MYLVAGGGKSERDARSGGRGNSQAGTGRRSQAHIAHGRSQADRHGCHASASLSSRAPNPRIRQSSGPVAVAAAGLAWPVLGTCEGATDLSLAMSHPLRCHLTIIYRIRSPCSLRGRRGRPRTDCPFSTTLFVPFLQGAERMALRFFTQVIISSTVPRSYAMAA